MAPKVELLYWEGCPSWPEAIELVRAAMAETGLDPSTLSVVQIDTEEDAGREGFAGSPTIRVDGRDVQPPPMPFFDRGTFEQFVELH